MFRRKLSSIIICFFVKIKQRSYNISIYVSTIAHSQLSTYVGITSNQRFVQTTVSVCYVIPQIVFRVGSTREKGNFFFRTSSKRMRYVKRFLRSVGWNETLEKEIIILQYSLTHTHSQIYTWNTSYTDENAMLHCLLSRSYTTLGEHYYFLLWIIICH